MGCKNTGSTANMYDRESHYEGPRFPIQHPPPAHVMQAASRGGKRAGEPWVAAQNLTFLKHGSPTSEQQQQRKRRAVGESGDIASMPSLASSSEGTSPGDAPKKHGFVTEEPGINSLMMAAYAMTEFGQGSGRYQKDDSKKQAAMSPKKDRKARASSTKDDAADASGKDETTETEPVQEI